MDKPTVIESVRYRCWNRGESLEDFLLGYCTEDDLVKASASPGVEGEFAAALLDMLRAIHKVHAISNRVE